MLILVFREHRFLGEKIGSCVPIWLQWIFLGSVSGGTFAALILQQTPTPNVKSDIAEKRRVGLRSWYKLNNCLRATILEHFHFSFPFSPLALPNSWTPFVTLHILLWSFSYSSLFPLYPQTTYFSVFLFPCFLSRTHGLNYFLTSAQA